MTEPGTDKPVTCLDHDETCRGPVQYRMPLSATGASFPRCDSHWDRRLNTEAGIRHRYPEQQPADFDPAYAGESWYEDE